MQPGHGDIKVDQTPLSLSYADPLVQILSIHHLYQQGGLLLDIKQMLEFTPNLRIPSNWKPSHGLKKLSLQSDVDRHVASFQIMKLVKSTYSLQAS